MENVAFEAAAIAAYPSRERWDAAATGIVTTMLDRWHLTAGQPYIGGEAAAVLRVTRRDGSPAVLKVGFPHAEAAWEAVALEAWGPGMAPRILLQDPWTWSMLLEEVRPGIPLSQHPVAATAALSIAAQRYLALRATSAVEGIPTLAEVVGGFLHNVDLTRQHADLVHLDALALVERGLTLAAELVATDRAGALLHGDYNPGNLLLDSSGDADRWLIVDPKPMLGDVEFDLFPLLGQVGSPLTHSEPATVLGNHLLLVTGIVRCDPERTASWCIARSALNVCWFAADGNHHAAVDAVRELRAWNQVSGS